MYSKFIATIFLLPAAAWADAPCVTDTLANYEALGAVGCSIKGLPFSNFAFTTVFASGGAVPVSAAQITVSPVDPAVAAGLNFASGGFSVAPGQAVKYQLEEEVDDPPIIHGWALKLFDPVTFPATITITSEECLGAAFVGLMCPTLSVVTNTVYDNGISAVLEDDEFFAPVGTVGELTTITLDASGGGSASFTSFTESAILLTPEPSSAVLLTPCIALLLFLARRRLLHKTV